MQKKASDYGFGRNVLHTVNSVLSWLFKYIKKYVSQSPVPAGLIKVPLITELPFWIFQKVGRLALWADIFIFELQFAETQGESGLQNGIFIYKPGNSVTKQDFHLQTGSLGLQMGFSAYYLPTIYPSLLCA